MTIWQTATSGSGQTGLAADGSGAVYAYDQGSFSVRKYGPGGEFLGGVAGAQAPIDLATDPAGNLYDLYRVAASFHISKYSPGGAALADIALAGGTGDGEFSEPKALAVNGGGEMYVVDYQAVPPGSTPPVPPGTPAAGRVQKLSPAGAFLTKWGSAGSGNGQFDFGRSGGSPSRVDIAIGAAGGVYVSDGSNRIQRFSGTGAFEGSWGGTGTAPGAFVDLQGISTDPAGNVYAADAGTFSPPSPPDTLGRIQKFDAGGRFIGEFAAAVYPPNWMAGNRLYASHIASSGANVLYATNGREIWRLEQTLPVARLQLPYPGFPTTQLSLFRSVLTGQQVVIDASASFVPFGRIVRHEYDLDGNGTYETAGGPAVNRIYGTAGKRTMRVRVTSDSGGTAESNPVAAEVFLAPPPGEIGVSINDGDAATDDPRVHLSLVWPAKISHDVLVSNDGGFGVAGGTRRYAMADRIPWTLRSSGSERLPKTVYVRIPGGIFPSITDDIILDERAPTTSAGDLLGAEGSARVWSLSVSLSGPVGPNGPAGVGTVAGSPAGVDGQIDCTAPRSGQCTVRYLEGQRVTLVAAPGRDSVFRGWSGGACGGAPARCSFIMLSNYAVEAAFGSALLGHLGRLAAPAAAKRRARIYRRYRIRLRASDDNSGVAAAQVSSKRSGGSIVTFARSSNRGARRLSRVLRVAVAAKPSYIRVRDSAGNWSRWRKLAPARRK